MIRGLVEQQNVSLEQHGADKSELHLPASRQGTDSGGDVGGELSWKPTDLSTCAISSLGMSRP